MEIEKCVDLILFYGWCVGGVQIGILTEAVAVSESLMAINW